jgi:hypothetical protein
MPRPTYDQSTGEDVQHLIDDIFKLGLVGYVALTSGQEVLMRLAPGIVSGTTAETNFYEELFVNPALLKLASQRGELDCGGLNYMAIGYGDFTQLIMLMRDGHISMGISRKENPGRVADLVNAVLKKHEQTWSPPDPWLLT